MLFICDLKISLSEIINSIIAMVAILTLISQLIQSRRNADFSFQPKFSFKKFCNHPDHEWTPMLCDGASKDTTSKCNKDHWFNIQNDSVGVAFKAEVFLIHVKEIKNFKYNEIEKERILKLNALIQDNFVQYKLAQGIISHHFYNQKENDSFYVIISYETISRFNKFIQIVELNYQPKIQAHSIQDWKQSIVINSSNVVYFEKISWWRKIILSNQKTYSRILELAKECQNDLN